MNIETNNSALLSVVPWRDELVEHTGYDMRGVYVERFWLPVIGPTCTVLLRRTAELFDANPAGFDVDLVDLGAQLGIVYTGAPRNAMSRTLDRLVRFDFARHIARGARQQFAVRRVAPPLAERHVVRLPASSQEALTVWNSSAQIPMRCASNSR